MRFDFLSQENFIDFSPTQHSIPILNESSEGKTVKFYLSFKCVKGLSFTKLDETTNHLQYLKILC